jgi:3-dehydroquinate synthase
MSKLHQLNVALDSRSYDVLIGAGALAQLSSQLPKLQSYTRYVLLSDASVEPLYAGAVDAMLTQTGKPTHRLTIPSGEGSKCFAQLQNLLEEILSHQPDRKTCLVALGGGVVGDLVGLLASLLLRGVDFVQLPTTLLAMVDSSVGGKTAINSTHGKNLIGAFWQPRLVLADLDTLATLPKRELLSGYAEVVKYAALGDATFFDWLEENATAALNGDIEKLGEMVAHCIRMKADIVAADEREAGQRAWLNLGHTLGHALEAETGYGSSLLHGEGVAIGMVFAFRLAEHLGLVERAAGDALSAHLKTAGLPAHPHDVLPAWDEAALLRHCYGDKKAEDGKLTFVLPRAMGRVEVVKNVPAEAVAATLAQWLAAGA